MPQSLVPFSELRIRKAKPEWGCWVVPSTQQCRSATFMGVTVPWMTGASSGAQSKACDEVGSCIECWVELSTSPTFDAAPLDTHTAFNLGFGFCWCCSGWGVVLMGAFLCCFFFVF